MPSTTEQKQQPQPTAEPLPVKEEAALEDNKVFVGNLSFKTTQETLAEFFKSSGKVVEATIIKHGRRSLGYGFVAFETAAEAEKSRKELNKKELEGREINVEVAKSKAIHGEKKASSPEAKEKARARKMRRRAARKARLAEAKKAQQAEKQQQQQSQQGGGSQPKDAPAKSDNNTPESSSNSAKSDDGQSQQHKKSRARRRGSTRKAAHREDRVTEPSKTALFVANLPYATTDEVLLGVFEKYKVKSAHIARMKNGRSKGYGFVELESEEEQQRALANIKDVELDGRAIYLKVALSEPNAVAQKEVNETSPTQPDAAQVAESAKTKDVASEKTDTKTVEVQKVETKTVQVKKVEVKKVEMKNIEAQTAETVKFETKEHVANKATLVDSKEAEQAKKPAPVPKAAVPEKTNGEVKK